MFDSFETRSFTKLCSPLLIDWRSIIILPKVPLQRAATDSCWAVATVVAIEAKYAILTGKQIKFSSQELLDCYPNTCLGWTHVAHMYAKYIGLSPEENYIWEEKHGLICRCKNGRKVRITGFSSVKRKFEYHLMHAPAV